MGEQIAAAEVLVLGASYREDVGDTRYSGSELIVRRLKEMGASVKVHDPYVEHWAEFEDGGDENDSAPSSARHFTRQDELANLPIERDLWAAMAGAKAIVLAVRHKPYLALDPSRVVASVGAPFALVDCHGILSDDAIRRYLELGCEVKSMGRGHIKRLKEGVRLHAGRHAGDAVGCGTAVGP